MMAQESSKGPTALDAAEKFHAMKIEKTLNQFENLPLHMHNFCY